MGSLQKTATGLLVGLSLFALSAPLVLAAAPAPNANTGVIPVINPDGTTQGSDNALQVPIATTKSLETIITSLIRLFLLFAGFIAFFYALYGGFSYLTAGADSEKADTGRKMITNAIIGLVVIFLSYAIVTFAIRALNNVNSSGTATGAGASQLNP